MRGMFWTIHNGETKGALEKWKVGKGGGEEGQMSFSADRADVVPVMLRVGVGRVISPLKVLNSCDFGFKTRQEVRHLCAQKFFFSPASLTTDGLKLIKMSKGKRGNV